VRWKSAVLQRQVNVTGALVFRLPGSERWLTSTVNLLRRGRWWVNLRVNDLLRSRGGAKTIGRLFNRFVLGEPSNDYTNVSDSAGASSHDEVGNLSFTLLFAPERKW
jgi:hypothetical protein